MRGLEKVPRSARNRFPEFVVLHARSLAG